jgi:gliding motility-associated lipoprotein GldD
MQNKTAETFLSSFFVKNHFKYIFLFVISIAMISSCDDEDDQIFSPKPRGYFRIDFPEKTYRMYDSVCPYRFEIPTYARITKDRHKGAEPCWINVEFPQFRATVHLSYKAVSDTNLNTFLEDSREFAIKHQIKATGLDESVVIRDSAKVYGLVYDIAGNTASSVQFYLTDSTKHFLRGALYFNTITNIDSLKIVIDFIRQDILHLVQTCEWKNEIPLEKIRN